MIKSIIPALFFIWQSQSSSLRFYEHSHASHFRQPTQHKIGVSNIPDITARLLQLGVFVKAYDPPQFLTFPRAPKGNLFVFVPDYAGEPLRKSVVSFHVDGYAKVSDIFAGSSDPNEVSSSLPDIVSAHFNSKMVCASRCDHLAKSMCGTQTHLAVQSTSQEIDPEFMQAFKVPKDMTKEFVLEMQLLLSSRQKGEVAVFFGVSSFKKVPKKHLKEAKRILEEVVARVLEKMPSNSVGEVLTMGPSSPVSNANIGVTMGTNRRLLATVSGTGKFIHLPGEFLAQIWVSVGGLFVVIAVAYYLAFMDYTQDSVLYTTMNPNLADRRR